jgi:prepilin-type N-terminal cleavage/methylation domain-containing protein
MGIADMRMQKLTRHAAPLQAGFSLLEMVIVCALLSIVLASIFGSINTAVQRSQSEQVKVDLVQEGREFIDEFERDLHQAGYPNCHMVQAVIGSTKYTCPADLVTAADTIEAESSTVAVGIAYLSNTKVIFEGDVDGDGYVDSVQYAVVDSAGNDPLTDPSGTCPCSIKRSQVRKLVTATSPLAQTPSWSQELENVVNSGVPTGTNQYGGGLSIAGNTVWGGTNTAFYAAVTSFKDYPVFQAYDQNGAIIALNPALDITTTTNSQILNCAPSSAQNCLKTIRITINLLGDAATGVDLQSRTRPVVTLMGDARLVNNVGNNY